MAQKKTYRLLSLAVMAVVLTALLALSAVAAEISTGFGKFSGDVSGYEAASVVLNSTGNGIAELEYFDLDKASNTGLAGLYYVRPEGSTENGDLIYVYGKISDRQTLGVFKEGATLPNTSSTSGTFAPGVFGVVNFNANSTVSGTNYTLFSTSWALSSKNKYVSALVSANATLKELKAAETPDPDAIAAAEADVLAKKQDLLSQIQNLSILNYGYASDDVIATTELDKISFSFSQNQGPVNVLKPSIKFYVIDPQGAVVPYTWESQSLTSSCTVDTTTVLPQEKGHYVLGFRLYPFGANMVASEVSLHSDTTASNYRNHALQYKITVKTGAKDYVIETPVATVAPEGLTFDEMTVYGLDENVIYNARPYTINGVDTKVAPIVISGVEEYTFDEPGLWAITHATCDYYTESISDYAIVYARGDYELRAKLFDRNDKDILVSTPTDSFKVGTITSSGLSAFNSYDNATMAQIIKFGNFSKSGATIEEKQAEFEAEKANAQKIHVSYAFTSDEIVHVSEVKQFTWSHWIYYSNFTYKNLVSKFIAYVALPDGTIKEYSYLHPAADYNHGRADYLQQSYNTYANGVKTVDFTSSDNWEDGIRPTEGYLVGFRALPFYGLTDWENVTAGSGIAAHLGYTTAAFHFSELQYVIEKPKYAAPTGLIVEGNTVANLDEDVTYLAYQVNVNGLDLENYVTISGVTEYTFADDEVGLWAIVISGDKNHDASEVGAYVYNRALTTDLKKLGTFATESSTVPQGTTGSYPNVFVPGKFVTSSTLNSISKDYKPSNGLASNSVSTTNSYQFHQVGYDTWIPKNDSDVKAYIAANAANDAGAKLQAQQNLHTKLQKFTMTYAFMPDEVVPVRDMVSFKYGTRSAQGNLVYFQPSVTFYTIGSDGEKHDYTWNATSKQYAHYSQLVVNWTVNAKTALAEAADDEVVVALEFKPYGALPAAQISLWSSDLTTSFNNTQQVAHYFWFDSYNINKPQAAAPTELELVGNNVTGLLDGVDYKYAPVSVNGVDYDKALDLTEDTTLDVGLWAVYYPENDDFTASLPVVFYVKGSYNDRQKLGVFAEGAVAPNAGSKGSGNKFVAGKFVTNTSLHAKGANLSGGDASSSSTADSYHFHQINFAPYKNDALVTAIVNAADATAKLQAKANLLVELKKVSMTYAFMPEEVIPANELYSLKYGVSSAQGNVGYYNPAVVFYTVDANGVQHTYTWNYGSVITAHYSGRIKAVIVNAASVLPQKSDEYVVAIEFLPYGAMTAAQVKLHNEKLNDTYNSDSQMRHFFWHKAYTIKKDPATIDASLILDGKIGVKVQANFQDASITEATFNLGVDADEITVANGIATAIYYVAPKDVSEFELSGTVTAGGVELNLTTTIDYLLGYYEANGSDKLKALASALATYCEYAENYFSDEAPLADLDNVAALADPVTAVRPTNQELAAVGLAIKSSSLILEGATTVRHYFTVIDKDLFEAANTSLTKVDYADDLYYIDVANVAAHELSTDTVATIAEGLVVKFSAIDYAKMAYTSTNPKLSNLVKALYNYSAAADDYRDANPID